MFVPKMSKMLRAGFFVTMLLLSVPALAQWSTQTIALRPGWNAVFLEVQPQPDDCATVFAGIPVETVWAWNRRFSSIQYVQDPATLVPGQPEWLTYIPASHKQAMLTNLFTLQGGRAYLVNLGGAEPVEWQITGEPTVRPIDWMSDSYNLVGFNVGGDALPTFETFFASSPAHAGQPMYRLTSEGEWERITDPSFTSMSRNEAYWIRCDGRSTYSGPVTLGFEQGGGLIYGRVLAEQTLTIRNESASAKTVTLNMVPSAEPPETTFPALAGNVPLSYYSIEVSGDTGMMESAGWDPVPQPLVYTVGAGEEMAMRLAVRRKDMAPFTLPAETSDAYYQSILEVAGGGTLYRVPVTARGLQSYAYTAKKRGGIAGAEDSPHPRSGLWVGSVVVDQVSEAATAGDTTVPHPTGSEFRFRLVVHVDADGTARLLQQVLLMQQPGTYTPDPADPSKEIVDVPLRYVLVTRDDLISQFEGAAVRDGELVGRRISSAAYAFPWDGEAGRRTDTVAMTGQFDSSLACTVTLSYDDPLNPFVHLYHPDHNNLDERYEAKLDDGKESYTFSRQVTLTFTDEDPDNLQLAGWGDNQVGGTYNETMAGVHKNAIYVAGTFRLRHVSRVAELNDGL